MKLIRGGLWGDGVGVGSLTASLSFFPKSNKNSPTPTTSCIEEALKEKEKPKEEEREKPKDTPGLECKPRPLHKTCSLFMRNIAPNISRAEIISVSEEKCYWGQEWHPDSIFGGRKKTIWFCF